MYLQREDTKIRRKNRLAMLLFLFIGIPFMAMKCSAQEKKDDADTVAIKSTLAEVVVHVFEQNNLLQDQPGAITYLSGKQFSRYDNMNRVSAMNSVPGVRMELRSPGSMRLNIRGSTLRAPFGVRNVKVYYNGVPFTDPGGNTYLNQLRFADIGAVEIIKGPAGSMYGAGTGGVLLIESDLYKDSTPGEDCIRLRSGVGSFGLLHGGLKVQWGTPENSNQLRYTELKKEGYRDHTKLKHRIIAYETSMTLNKKEKLNAFFHYSDLYYQTPGALTKARFDKDPRAARPASGPWPSSEENKAAVHQKAFLLGLKHTYQFTNTLKNTTAVYGAYTNFTNPTVRNYELRKEPHFGGRTVFQYRHHGENVQSSYWLGAEFQQGYFSQQDFQNDRGNPDSLMSSHRVNAVTAFLFAQAAFIFPHGWKAGAGMSMNHRKLSFSKKFPAPAVSFVNQSHLVFMPRIALSKKIGTNFLVYADLSKGFSPPAVPELLPSTNQLNKNLEAEQGMQYQIGSKGHLPGHRLYYDINLFVLQLTQSISLRRDSSGADYFVNAGGVRKKGIELALNYILFQNEASFFSHINVWNSLTVFDFKYKDYIADHKDYSGNKMPGAAPFTNAGGIDMHTSIGLSAYVTWQHTSEIPLNNANTVYSGVYDLLGFRMAYQNKITDHIGISIAAGGDNLLNEKYSLGNDINAYGGRYFNVAPPVNFYTQIGIKYYF